MEKIEKNIFENENIDWLKIADELEKMQANKNEGRGISCIKRIIADLRRGALDEAKAVCWNDHDKVSSYPEIESYLEKNLFSEDEDSPGKSRERMLKDLREEKD